VPARLPGLPPRHILRHYLGRAGSHSHETHQRSPLRAAARRALPQQVPRSTWLTADAIWDSIASAEARPSAVKKAAILERRR
jgi:hypothetical protein